VNAAMLPPPPAAASGWALYLDLDGTLAPLRAHPDDVVVDAAVLARLGELHRRLDGAICVLSGRPLPALRRLFGAAPVRLVGGHGSEGLHDEDDAGDDAASPVDAALRADLAALAAAADGAWLEHKAHGAALHYRACPAAGPTLRDGVAALVGARGDLRIVAGDAVVEVLPAHVSKGDALRRLQAMPPFRGRVPVAVGDDVTDEDAFAAAAALGGFGVIVGPRRPTAARHALADADAVQAWLAGFDRCAAH
jgi:trehalose 6-phosphate phosphatase